MVNINKEKAKVISFPNEYGRDQFQPYLKNLGKKAIGKHDVRVQFAYLLKALEYMQYVDFINLPKSSEEQFFAELEIDVDGTTYSKSFELIKPLDKEDIYELRINLEESNWRFRGIFFPYSYHGQQFYCFVFALEKQNQVRVNLTNQYRDRAYNVLNLLTENPERYGHLFKI